jgi:hypothetical protein
MTATVTQEAEQKTTHQEPKYTRLSVNLSPDTAAALRELADRRKISITDAVRRAIAVWKFMEDEIAAGNRVVVTEPDGKKREIVLLS